ncbi:MAG TPA: hypothetical protein VD865_16945 [Stenotrophomonas sp.]|nr:hypothetical protein [Stenotrophomonas sp.]
MSDAYPRGWGIAALVAAGLLMAGVLVWNVAFPFGNGAAPAGSQASATPRPVPNPASKRRERSPTSIEGLIRARRIEPGMARRLAGRAFLIQRPRERRPPGDAAAFARTLLPASADGDGTASYRLYLIASECETAVSPGVIESYRLTKDLLAPDYPKVMARQMQECEGLLMDPVLSNSGRWLDLAAAQGSLEAGVAYSLLIDRTVSGPEVWLAHPERVIEFKRKALRYLEEGAALGNVSALLALSQVYTNGVMAPADPVRALAYWQVLDQVEPVPSSRFAMRLEEGLSAAQRNEARRQAAEIRQWCCSE